MTQTPLPRALDPTEPDPQREFDRTAERVFASKFHKRHDGARLPIDLPDDDEPPFRHWVGGDYEEREATDAEIRSTGGGFAILCGLLLGIATVMALAVANNWPWISATVAGWL